MTAGPQLPDIVDTLVGILGSIVSANVGNRVVHVNALDATKREGTQFWDAVLVYPVTSNDEEVGVTRDYQDIDDVGCIEIMTIASRLQKTLLQSEVNRLLYASFKNPTTLPAGSIQYHLLKPKGGWMRVADYTNSWRYKREVEGIANWVSRS